VLPPADAGCDPLPGRGRDLLAVDAVDFPGWDRVYAFFRRWRQHGLITEFHDRLRGRVREREGREVEPTAGISTRSR
ncbi:hypothetical protein AB0884_29880, partial [Streptomyces sp. NPDC005283]